MENANVAVNHSGSCTKNKMIMCDSKKAGGDIVYRSDDCGEPVEDGDILRSL